jgi:hypothetical protein
LREAFQEYPERVIGQIEKQSILQSSLVLTVTVNTPNRVSNDAVVWFFTRLPKNFYTPFWDFNLSLPGLSAHMQHLITLFHH